VEYYVGVVDFIVPLILLKYNYHLDLHQLKIDLRNIRIKDIYRIWQTL